MYWLWNRHGRDPRRQPVAVQYEPPGALTPAEVGTLVDNSSDMRDITATIVDLAVRGFLRIKETSEDRFLGLGTKTGTRSSWCGPTANGRTCGGTKRRCCARCSAGPPGSVSSPGAAGPVIDEVSIDDLKNRFYKHVPEIKERVFSQLIDKGYYLRRPDRVRATFYVLAGIVAIGGSVVSGIAEAGAAPFVASILSGLIIGVFGHFMPARTVEGARALEGSLGFEEFLDRVESDRFERIVKTPAMFEKFLPFAMALGVERNWAKAFEGIYTSQPDWYVGTYHGSFGPWVFASSLADLSSNAGAAMTSAPRSSGGSGAGGGGFSARRIRRRRGRRVLMRIARGVMAAALACLALGAAGGLQASAVGQGTPPRQSPFLPGYLSQVTSRRNRPGAHGPRRPVRRAGGHGPGGVHGRVLAQRRERRVQCLH